jgi:hypothetical protein
VKSLVFKRLAVEEEKRVDEEREIGYNTDIEGAVLFE